MSKEGDAGTCPSNRWGLGGEGFWGKVVKIGRRILGWICPGGMGGKIAGTLLSALRYLCS